MANSSRGAAAAPKREKGRNQDVAAQISQENRPQSEIVQMLQRQVANSFMLYTNYKHYHWQVTGPLFRDLHLLFDELAKDVLETIDDFAERIRMIGQDPVWNPVEMADIATVKSSGSGLSLRQMIEEADSNLLSTIMEMREGARTADEINDPGTADLFSNAVQVHEKHEWYLRDILKDSSGILK
jgi:starvation-inducible DNA-binding protein